MSTAALQGASSGSSNSSSHHNSSINNSADAALDDFHFSSSQLLSLLDSKDDAFQALKSDLMDSLNKGVKSLDEDSWMFDGPRSRINLISKSAATILSSVGKLPDNVITLVNYQNLKEDESIVCRIKA